VYVYPEEVASVLKHGYLSVFEQVKQHLTTEAELLEKYGQQHKKALALYPDCPKNIFEYLKWRCEDEGGDGRKAIYFLLAPLDHSNGRRAMEFASQRVLLELTLPDLPSIPVPASHTPGLWLSDVPHAYMLAGKIEPADVAVVGA
jgi:hypothetical protein